MTIFLSGGAKCGKSGLAQELVRNLAGGSKHYYVATLISSGPEDDLRIRKHLADREGMGFETIECFRDLMDCLSQADSTGAFLVDSVTSLMQNALFPPEKDYEMDLEAADRCIDSLVRFAGTVKHAVFVSDYIYSDAQPFSSGTEQYRQCLAKADRALAAVCDTVVEVSAGGHYLYKGELPL